MPEAANILPVHLFRNGKHKQPNKLLLLSQKSNDNAFLPNAFQLINPRIHNNHDHCSSGCVIVRVFDHRTNFTNRRPPLTAAATNSTNSNSTAVSTTTAGDSMPPIESSSSSAATNEYMKPATRTYVMVNYTPLTSSSS